MAKDHETLIQTLAAELRPVRRLWPAWVRALLFVAICGAIAAGLAAVAGSDTVLRKLAGGPMDMLEVAAGALTAVLAAMAAFQLATPGRSPAFALLPLPSFVVWVAASGWGCWRTETLGPDPASLNLPQSCFRFIVGMSVPLSAVMFVMLRRAYSVRPGLTATMAGLACAAASATLLVFVHPFGVTAPDLVVHGAAIAIVIGANRLASGRLLRRLALVALLALSANAARAETTRPLVVELFTSQGCSSCPPADALLGEFARGRPDLLPLAFHVDYWNRLGWTDPFSSAAFTARQRLHAARLGEATVYTPEMVIDGRRAVVGSDRAAVQAAIRAAKSQTATLAVVSVRAERGEVAIRVGPGAGAASVLLVGFDRSHTTPIGRGENGGRTLQESNIVRSFERVAAWTGAALDVRRPAPAGEQFAVLLEAADGRVVGAAIGR